MIIDHIEKLESYAGLHPLFQKAIKYIQSLNFSEIEEGKFELDGNNLFVSITNSSLKTPENAKLEVHNQYIDIQLPVSKAETFGWSPRKEMQKESAPFDETKDIQFFEDKPTTYFTLQPGNFAIFFPQDAHAPCIGEGSVQKIVIKVKI